MTSYVLSAKHDNIHTILREGEAIHDMVEDGNYNYYKFSIAQYSNKSDILSIKF